MRLSRPRRTCGRTAAASVGAWRQCCKATAAAWLQLLRGYAGVETITRELEAVVSPGLAADRRRLAERRAAVDELRSLAASAKRRAAHADDESMIRAGLVAAVGGEDGYGM